MSERSLTDRGFNALKWNYAGNGARVAFQFLIGVVLARLLGPESFGVVAVAWLMIGIGALFADLGFSAALIQRKTLDEDDVTTAFTLQMAMGAGLSLLGATLAAPIAAFFNKPEAVYVIRAMSAMFVIRALGQTSTALLNRDLRYKATQAVNVVTYAIGYGLIGIGCAYTGLGAWSLVAGQLAQAALYSVAMLIIARRPLRFGLPGERRGLFKFGGAVVAANTASWAILNLDSVVIGHTLGVAPLGLYNRAMNLVAGPMGAATASLQAVLFAASSRVHGELPRLQRAYLTSTSALTLLAFPVLATVAAVPQTTVLGIYGSAWRDAAAVLTPLALAMMAHVALALVGPVLMAANRTGREVSAQVIVAVLMPPVLYLASRHSLAAVGWAVFGIYVARMLALFAQLVRTIKVAPTAIAAAMLPAFLCALATASSTLIFDRSVHVDTPSLKLLMVMTFAGSVLLLIARLGGRRIFHGPLGETLLGGGKLPAPVRGWLRV